MIGLTLKHNGKYIVSAVSELNENAKYNYKITIDSKDNFEKDYHARAEILVMEIGDVKPGCKIKLEASAPVFQRIWNNGSYVNKINVYSNATVSIEG